VTIFALTCAESLGDQGVQPHEKAAAEEREDHEKVGAETDGAHGVGAVWEMADHDSVHDSHAHPAELGQHQRKSQTDGGAKLLSQNGNAEHGGRCKKFMRRVEKWQSEPELSRVLGEAGAPLGAIGGVTGAANCRRSSIDPGGGGP